MLKKLSCSAAALALGACWSSVSAQEFTGPNGTTATFYGQLNIGWLSFDDGQETESAVVDNANSNSRVGVNIDWAFANDTKLRFNFETSLGFLQSSALNIDGYDDWFYWDETYIRKLDLQYGGNFGKVYAGQGSMATDGAAESDLSGTTLAGYSAFGEVAGGFAFRNADGTLSGVKVGSVFKNLDGSRRFRLRYDTPEFSSFTVAFAYGEEILKDDDNTYYDIALRYANTIGEVKVAAAIGYGVTDKPDGGDDVETVMGSVSALHQPSGISMTLAAGEQIDSGTYLYLKLGWQGDLIAAGKTAIAVEYMTSDDLGVDGSGDSWGLMAVQTFGDASTEVYAGYREYSVSDNGADLQDASSFLIGARWKF